MFTRNHAERLALKFIKLLEKNNIFIRESYLFGSVVNNKNTEYSDIDIALVSDSFAGSRFDDRKKINHYVKEINSSLEIHPFYTKEFSKDNPFVNEILKTGIKLSKR